MEASVHLGFASLNDPTTTPMLYALHGFTENDESWAETLGGEIADLRCPLLPGHGSRPCPSGTTIKQAAAELVARFPTEPVDLLGYSMGGRVALAVALDHPQRIRRLILVSCHGGIRDAAERANRRKRDESLAQVLEEDGIGAFVAWWETQSTLKPYQPFSATVAASVRARRLNQEPLGLAGCLRSIGAGAMEPQWSRLSTLRMPTLLVSGSADTRYRTLMDEMHTMIPGSRRDIVLRSGHAVHRERPQVIAQMVGAFLER